MKLVKLDDARDQLSDLIDAAFRGEQVISTKDNQEMVELVPITPAKGR